MASPWNLPDVEVRRTLQKKTPPEGRPLVVSDSLRYGQLIVKTSVPPKVVVLSRHLITERELKSLLLETSTGAFLIELGQ